MSSVTFTIETILYQSKFKKCYGGVVFWQPQCQPNCTSCLLSKRQLIMAYWWCRDCLPSYAAGFLNHGSLYRIHWPEIKASSGFICACCLWHISIHYNLIQKAVMFFVDCRLSASLFLTVLLRILRSLVRVSTLCRRYTSEKSKFWEDLKLMVSQCAVDGNYVFFSYTFYNVILVVNTSVFVAVADAQNQKP